MAHPPIILTFFGLQKFYKHFFDSENRGFHERSRLRWAQSLGDACDSRRTAHILVPQHEPVVAQAPREADEILRAVDALARREVGDAEGDAHGSPQAGCTGVSGKRFLR